MLGGVYVLHTFVFFLIIIKGVNEGLQGKVSYLRFLRYATLPYMWELTVDPQTLIQKFIEKMKKYTLLYINWFCIILIRSQLKNLEYFKYKFCIKVFSNIFNNLDFT